MKASTTTMMMTTMLTANGWDLFWIAWMLVFCAANGAAVVSCVAFLIAHYKDGDDTAAISDNVAHASAADSTPPSSWASIAGAFTLQDPPSVCGKRKTRDKAFGMTSTLSQGKWKQQRCRTVVTQVSFQPKAREQQYKNPSQFSRARAFSFGDAATLLRGGTGYFPPLRRVVSCGNVDISDLRHCQELRPAASTKLFNSNEIQHSSEPVCEGSLVATVKSQLRSFLAEKLRTAARNAVDEVLTSVFSFLTYAMLLFLVRQYSAVAIGVSLDLGAFSIEL